MIHYQEPAIPEKERTEVRLKNKNTNAPDITDKDVFFAKERYQLHEATPDEGVSVDILKKYFSKKYGF